MIPSLRHPYRVALLVGVATLLNAVSVELPGDARLFLGSFVYMPLVLILPLPWAILAAAIPMSVTISPAGHPFALLIAVLEAAWLKITPLNHRRSVLVRDGLFWALVTVPAFYGLYYKVAEIPIDLVILIACKQIVNQLTAVGTANFMVRQTAFPTWINGDIRPRRRMRDTVFHSVFILAIVPLVVVGVGVAMILRAYCAREDIEVLTGAGQHFSQQLDQFIADNEAVITSAASMITRGANPVVVLEETKRTHPEFITMLVADQRGGITATAPGLALERATVTQVFDRDYFQRAKSTGRTFVSGVFRGRGFGRHILVAISAPVYDAAGQFSGIIEGSLEIHSFAHLIADREDDVDVVLADANGRVIFAEAETGLNPLDQLRHSPQRGALRESVPVTFDADFSGENTRITALAVRAPRTGVIVVAQRPVLAGLDGSQWLIVLFAGAAATVAIAAWWVTGSARREMAAPLERFTKGTMEQAARRVVEPFEALPNDAPYEVMMMFRSFNQLAVQLQGTYAMLRTANEELDRRVVQRTEEAVAARRAAEQANQSKTDFLAMTSHEIRTPLNAIIGLAESLGPTAASPVTADRLKTIQRAGHRLLNVVNDLLDLSKVEAGKLELRKHPVLLPELCREVHDLFALKASEQGTKLAVECDPCGPILSDAIRLQQILINLVGNALKFTTAGEVALCVKALAVTGTQTVLRFSVTDTGPGITEDQQSRLFQPYVQLETNAQQAAKGTGLGLAISRKLVELLGGTLSIQSQVGVGSEFYFVLEFEPAHVEHVEMSVATPEAPATKPRVLAVDDDVANREVLHGLLEPMCDQLVVVESAAAALEQFSAHTFDIALVDLEMPGTNGFTLAAQIRSQSGPASAECWLIACSAHTRNSQWDRCSVSGFDDFVEKPILRAELVRALSLCERKRQFTPF